MNRLKLILAALLLAAPFANAADISITAADVVPSSAAITASYTAGATITAGQLVYYDTATSTVKLADGNSTISTATIRGIALGGASSSQRVLICLYDPELTIGGSRTIGDVYIASATAGAIAPVADLASGTWTTVVGVAVSATKICFDVRLRSPTAKS